MSIPSNNYRNYASNMINDCRLNLFNNFPEYGDTIRYFPGKYTLITAVQVLACSINQFLLGTNRDTTYSKGQPLLVRTSATNAIYHKNGDHVKFADLFR